MEVSNKWCLCGGLSYMYTAVFLCLGLDRPGKDFLKYQWLCFWIKVSKQSLFSSENRVTDLQTNGQKGDAGAFEIMRAYEFSLDKLGTESRAGILWQEFLGFLSNIRVNTSCFTMLFTPVPGQEQSARSARLRTHYQKALQARLNHTAGPLNIHKKMKQEKCVWNRQSQIVDRSSDHVWQHYMAL